jgi:3-oxoacyl-[acyl-carrier protein] reductase
MRGIQGRAALVTGAGRGIGRAIALRLATEGARVAVNDLDAEVANTVVDDIAAAGGSAVTVLGSVAVAADAGRIVDGAAEQLGGLDIVVNNAGVTRDSMIHRMSDEDWDLVVDVSLRGTFNVCRAAAAHLRRGKGEEIPYHRKVVNMASINGLYGIAGNANYSAAKGGVIALTKSLSREWAPQRINVNAIAPGFIEGTRLTAAREEGDALGIPEEVLDRIRAQMPLGRAGTPDDVAGLVAFLASRDADWLTGQVIELSGGREMVELI